MTDWMTARFDVTNLTEEERGQLALEVAVQHERSDGHPSVPPPELEWDTTPDDAGARVLGSDAAQAVGRFNPDGPVGYRAATAPDAPLRATRAEAEQDERRAGS